MNNSTRIANVNKNLNLQQQIRKAADLQQQPEQLLHFYYCHLNKNVLGLQLE